MKQSRLLALSFLACMASSCGLAEFEDVSAQAPYKTLIADKFESSQELLAHGVTIDRNYSPVLSYYTVTALPGISGPEILSRTSLPTGTLMTVVSVGRCTNCPFDRRVRVLVRLDKAAGFELLPVYVPYDLFSSGAIKRPASGNRT